ncbi:THUMP domain-containing class I SAM-dependent RNA methyltransferase [Crocosphaera sp. XPORK-15E]|uniref:THUMP domain-containing class I SAM-dependent RNA methyltransferase n=1 Tax=Crocosphaera sp. XPORK-15E TaxID=3110247 RepID=UPI002B1FB18C|nr:THUMP domain-containing protein [Crocosphaera sp. XPORK-15E]MEA5536583.1 THUMP domain-containing protein [Crocosphaera sp. XPORK-15E]
MTNNYFATVARGLEEIAAQELEKLGAISVKPEFTGVHFQGDKSLLYKVNLWSRIVFRVLVPIQTIPSANSTQLYDSVQQIDWTEYLQPDQTFAVNCTGSNQQLNHSHFTALQVKNAIVDQQQDRFKERSYIDPKYPDILINAHIYENRCFLSLDSSGESLHRRGYRPAMGLAPLKETLASAILDLANWTPNLPFLDPLCGSGILPIEATLKSLNIAPGLARDSFSFQHWSDFDSQLYDTIIKEAINSQNHQLEAPIFGSDRDLDVIQQAQINAKKCNIDHHIKLTQMSLENVEPPTDQGIIICNPPYGKRLGNTQELGALYTLLGDVFKQRFKGWTAYVLTGNKELSKQIGLRTARRIPVYNGSLPCTLLKYELY